MSGNDKKERVPNWHWSEVHHYATYMVNGNVVKRHIIERRAAGLVPPEFCRFQGEAEIMYGPPGARKPARAVFPIPGVKSADAGFQVFEQTMAEQVPQVIKAHQARERGKIVVPNVVLGS